MTRPLPLPAAPSPIQSVPAMAAMPDLAAFRGTGIRCALRPARDRGIVLRGIAKFGAGAVALARRTGLPAAIGKNAAKS
jgi:hypothetical protein